ncbi:hypothetical protein [Paraburkholderia panacisoli]|nr:hypothetical protein [Paraburkholderia panacisoli]
MSRADQRDLAVEWLLPHLRRVVPMQSRMNALVERERPTTEALDREA